IFSKTFSNDFPSSNCCIMRAMSASLEISSALILLLMIHLHFHVARIETYCLHHFYYLNHLHVTICFDLVSSLLFYLSASFYLFSYYNIYYTQLLLIKSSVSDNLV